MEKMEDTLLHSCVFVLTRLLRRKEVDAIRAGLSLNANAN